MSQQTNAASSAPRRIFTPPLQILQKMQASPATSLEEIFSSGQPFPRHVYITCDAEVSTCGMCYKGPNGPFAIIVIGNGIHYLRLTVSGVHNLPKGWYTFTLSGNAKESVPEYSSPYVMHEISVKEQFTATPILPPEHRVWPTACLENWFIAKRQGKEVFDFEIQVGKITDTHISFHDLSFSGEAPKIWALTTEQKPNNPLFKEGSRWKIRAIPSWQIDPKKETQDTDVTMTEIQWLTCLDSPHQDTKRQREEAQGSLIDEVVLAIPNKQSTIEVSSTLLHSSAPTAEKPSCATKKAPLPSQK